MQASFLLCERKISANVPPAVNLHYRRKILQPITELFDYSENLNSVSNHRPQSALSGSCFRWNRDPDNVLAVALLDLIGVSKTMDHHILMQSLENMASLWGHELYWFKSFMSWRFLSVWGDCVFLMLLITYDQVLCWLCDNFLHIYSHLGNSHNQTMFFLFQCRHPSVCRSAVDWWVFNHSSERSLSSAGFCAMKIETRKETWCTLREIKSVTRNNMHVGEVITSQCFLQQTHAEHNATLVEKQSDTFIRLKNSVKNIKSNIINITYKHDSKPWTISTYPR